MQLKHAYLVVSIAHGDGGAPLAVRKFPLAEAGWYMDASDELYPSPGIDATLTRCFAAAVAQLVPRPKE